MRVVSPLFVALVDDAAMFPPGNAAVAEAVAAHRDHRRSWFAPLVGPLVVRDQALGELGRALGGAEVEVEVEVEVSVVNTGGAAGLRALAGRRVEGVRVRAVETPLTDLDDLSAEAARLAAAADELDGSLRVFVELPYAPGWEGAVEVVAAAGLLGKLRTGGPAVSDTPAVAQLTRQLRVLVAADLPFKATAGLHHAWPAAGPEPDRPAQHGFLCVLAAVDALAAGASDDDAAALLGGREPGVLEDVRSWSDARGLRVRRRFRSFGCCGVTDPLADLVALGLLREPR